MKEKDMAHEESCRHRGGLNDTFLTLETIMGDENNKLDLELYKYAIDEEQFFLIEHHKRIEFYTGLISALLTATLFGIFRANHWYHFFLTFIGPILILFVCRTARECTKRSYRRFLEAITMRAKIEHKLKMDIPPNTTDCEWYAKEQLLSGRHLSERNQCLSSEEWVKRRLEVNEINGKLESKNIHGLAEYLLSRVSCQHRFNISHFHR